MSNTDLIISKTDAMMEIQAAVSYLDKLSGGVPEIQNNLRVIFENARELVRKVTEYEQTLVNAEQYIERVEIERNELLKQRDAVLDELNDFINDMKAGEFWNNDTSMEVYESAVEQHNEAFWQSLPYDIASMIGGEWTFGDADLLYDAITASSDIEFADGRAMPVEAVQTFRADLLNLVRKLRDQEGTLL